MAKNSYELIDSGNGRKLERFGPYVLSRPCSVAVWPIQRDNATWERADLIFTREQDNRWIKNKDVPSSWTIEVEGIIFKIQPTDFGHLGIFPEQKPFWRDLQDEIALQNTKRKTPLNILNLFAYSGGSTLASAKAGASVCHLDASKGMVSWARENAALNKLENAPIRWIVDDAIKFLTREIKRQSYYDGIILDPPTFGRGAKAELFKIEEHIVELLCLCKAVLSQTPSFILLSCHTPGFSPLVLDNLLRVITHDLPGTVESGEMILSGSNIFSVPSGSFARWRYGR